MASKMVTDRQKSAEAVVAVGRAQGDTLSEALRAKLPKGAAVMNVNAIVDALTENLADARDAMVEADAVHEREVADDPAAREGRNAAAAALSAKLVEQREVLVGLYGSATAQQVLPGRTPQDPVVLARYAGEVAVSLRNIVLPKPRVADATLDTIAAAAELDVLRTRLENHLASVAREAREYDITLVRRNERIARYDRVFQGVATVLTGLFTLAGEDELANRVRPSSRRPGRTAADESGETDEDTEMLATG